MNQQLIADTRDSDSSPYQEQMDRGFGLLKFSDVLEEEFQATSYFDRLVQIRQTVVAVAVFVLVVLVADMLLNGSHFSRPVVAVQGAFSLGLLSLMFWQASRKQPSRRVLTITGILLGLHFGYINLLLNIYYPPTTGVIPPDLWYVCCTFLIYFCFGLAFRQALLLSALLFGGYLTWVFGNMGKSIVTFYPLLFLAMSNVFSAFGLYNIEYNQRKLFLQSRKMQYLAEHDPLTGLLNRRAMKQLLRRVWGHCEREKLPLSLAVINIDSFADYRQKYGQEKAARCLVEVARLLEQGIQRPLDFVAGYSSEEFVLVLPGCSQENALTVINRLQDALGRLEIGQAGGVEHGKITLSIGLVTDRPDNRSTDPESLLQKGDAVAFEAGRKGGNTIVTHRF